MLSDIEIPLLDLDADDPFGDYRAGLDALAGAADVRLLVPGHGHVGDRAEFRRRIDADRRYLDTTEAGGDVADPRLAEAWLQAEHARHVTRARTPG
jgi:hydroxyacylglutathione hydrolase